MVNRKLCMQEKIKFHNVNLTDLRETVNQYDMQSIYRALHTLNGAGVGYMGTIVCDGDVVSEYVALQHVSHIINDLTIVDDMIIGNVTILNTPVGQIAMDSLVKDDKLICGFSMSSMVELKSDGVCVVEKIVAFHLSPKKSPITRIVNWDIVG